MPQRRKRRRSRSRFSLRNLFRSKPRRSARKQPLNLETLEGRVLLTTLVGGDVFEYIDATGKTIRIATAGDIIAEVVAADIDDQNNVVLGDMPGTFIDSAIGKTGTDILGGRGGAGGGQPAPLAHTGGAPRA